MGEIQIPARRGLHHPAPAQVPDTKMLTALMPGQPSASGPTGDIDHEPPGPLRFTPGGTWWCRRCEPARTLRRPPPRRRPARSVAAGGWCQPCTLVTYLPLPRPAASRSWIAATDSSGSTIATSARPPPGVKAATRSPTCRSCTPLPTEQMVPATSTAASGPPRAAHGLQRGGYGRLDDQWITQHTGRAENPLVVKSVQLG